MSPSNGSAFNQIAVLCTYSEDQLGAAYYYCRSVLVEKPFETGIDNLHKLFGHVNKQVCVCVCVCA